jgi:phosphinothricin acetyltransferase
MQNPSMQIRRAIAADVAAIQEIYSHHALHGTGTFTAIPPSVEEIHARFIASTEAGDLWYVAEDRAGVHGFACFGRFHGAEWFRTTAENQVYVREGVRGQGLGKALVAALLQPAYQAGYRNMIAVIGDSDNAGSIGLHAALGFQRVGILRGVGEKFGRKLDAIYMQRTLGPGD